MSNDKGLRETMNENLLSGTANSDDTPQSFRTSSKFRKSRSQEPMFRLGKDKRKVAEDRGALNWQANNKRSMDKELLCGAVSTDAAHSFLRTSSKFRKSRSQESMNLLGKEQPKGTYDTGALNWQVNSEHPLRSRTSRVPQRTLSVRSLDSVPKGGTN